MPTHKKEKNQEKMKKLSQLLKAYIAEMPGVI